MSPDLAQRLLALAAAMLVALVVALAVQELREDGADAAEPATAPAPGGGWYSSLAGPYAFPSGESRTECGYGITARTQGVAHAVLPCGAKLVFRLGGRLVLTQVVDRDPGAQNREFGFTRPLARRVGLRDVARVRWRFAAP
ncbi:MAG: hypothetical protein ICV64_03115 [Thermoleophilia bacterium]|nr:hypothetical protein [Thermoleophilia bacterium]